MVSLIEPDIGCKLIRVSSPGPLSGLIAMKSWHGFFFPPKQWLAPCYSYWAGLATLAPKISVTLWLHKSSGGDWESCWLADFNHFITMWTLKQLQRPRGQKKDTFLTFHGQRRENVDINWTGCLGVLDLSAWIQGWGMGCSDIYWWCVELQLHLLHMHS